MNTEIVMWCVKHAQRKNLRMWLREELIFTTHPQRKKALIEAILTLDELGDGVPPCSSG